MSYLKQSKNPSSPPSSSSSSSSSSTSSTRISKARLSPKHNHTQPLPPPPYTSFSSSSSFNQSAERDLPPTPPVEGAYLSPSSPLPSPFPLSLSITSTNVHNHPTSHSSDRNGSANGNSHHVTIFNEIESLEQQLITHLHTSGLRPQRETSLVDEVMSLRKERRKLFTSLITQNSHLLEQSSQYQHRISFLDKEIDTKVKEKTYALNLKLEEMEVSLQSYKTQLAVMNEDRQGILEQDRRSLQLKYEDKMRLLDEKLSQLRKSEKERDQSNAEHLAAQMLATARQEDEAVIKAKLDKYRNAVRSMAERERETELSLQSCQQKCSQHEEAIAALRRKLSLSMASEESAIDRLRILERTSNTTSNEVNKLKEILKQKEIDAIQMEQDLELNHTKEMESIDIKIRNLLKTRDENIKKLNERLVIAEAARKEAEHVLNVINEGLQHNLVIQLKYAKSITPEAKAQLKDYVTCLKNLEPPHHESRFKHCYGIIVLFLKEKDRNGDLFSLLPLN